MSLKEDQPSIVEEPDLSGTYTATDYLSWQLDDMVELIRGKLFKMTPAPSSNHQCISVELSRVVSNFFHNKSCKAFHAPFDVYFVNPEHDYKTTKNIVQPDLCVICDSSKIKKFGCVGAPDLVVEILSPSTAGKDQKDKFELYEEYGVKEYWVVSPENHSVIVHVLENNQYKTFRPVTENEILHSKTFPDLKINLKEVFQNLTEQ